MLHLSLSTIVRKSTTTGKKQPWMVSDTLQVHKIKTNSLFNPGQNWACLLAANVANPLSLVTNKILTCCSHHIQFLSHGLELYSIVAGRRKDAQMIEVPGAYTFLR